MKLLTAVVSVHLNLDVNKHNAQRLYEVEKKRISGKRTNDRLDQLERKRKEVREVSCMGDLWKCRRIAGCLLLGPCNSLRFICLGNAWCRAGVTGWIKGYKQD